MKRNRKFLWFTASGGVVVLILFLLVFTRTSPQLISGHVIDGSGNPVTGATVKMQGIGILGFTRETKTDKQGEFKVDAPTLAYDVLVWAEKDGMSRFIQKEYNFLKNGYSDMEIQLFHSSSYSGILLDDKGEAHNNQNVLLVYKNPERVFWTYEGVSDQKGHFKIDGIIPGEYSFSLSTQRSYRSDTIEHRFTIGEDEDISNLVIRTGPIDTAVIAGSIINEEGRKVRGANVHIRSTELKFYQTFVTDADGLFKFSRLPQGEYAIRVTARGYLDYDERGFMVNDKELTVTLHEGF